MYRQCEVREVCMYNIYSNNHSAHIFTTYWFLRSNGFHDYCTSEYTGKHFQKKKFQKACH